MIENATMSFRLKLGTFEKAVCQEPSEVVTVDMRTPLNSEVTAIVISVVADTNVAPDVRGREIGKLMVCTAVTHWLGKRPKGVTPYGISTQAVDNIPVWILGKLMKKARQLYNKSMKEDRSVCPDNNQM